MVPALFIGHGSPMLAVQKNEYSRFLGELGRRFKPKAIAIFSAHWESEILSLTYTDGVVPLFLAMGSGEEDKAPVVIHRSYEFGTLSNMCFEM